MDNECNIIVAICLSILQHCCQAKLTALYFVQWATLSCYTGCQKVLDNIVIIIIIIIIIITSLPRSTGVQSIVICWSVYVAGFNEKSQTRLMCKNEVKKKVWR